MSLRPAKSINQSIIRCNSFIFVFIIFDILFHLHESKYVLQISGIYKNIPYTMYIGSIGIIYTAYVYAIHIYIIKISCFSL